MQITDLAIAARYAKKADPQHNSHTRKVGWKIPLVDFIKLYRETEVCHFTGIKVDHSNESIERLNPLLPYQMDNVVIISDKANKVKGHTIDALIHNGEIGWEAKAKMLQVGLDVVNTKINTMTKQVTESIHAIKHVVREGAPFMLDKMYKNGSRFLLKSDDAMIECVLVIEVLTKSIPHGRGHRVVDIENNYLMNVKTFQKYPAQVPHTLAKTIVVLEKAE